MASSTTAEMEDIYPQDEPALFRKDCSDCRFCDGLRDFEAPEQQQQIFPEDHVKATTLIRSLSFLDRFLAVFILAAMIIGVLLGVYAEGGVRRALKGAEWEGVSIPVLLGLLFMMWPILTKVQYECLPKLFTEKQIWVHIGISTFLNWIIAPFIMLALAWATLPEASLERERKGVILVGIARCIAMVLIWTGLAKGDSLYCAILVGVNSLLQIVLFAPYSLLFLNILGSNKGSNNPALQLDYSRAAKSVGIYLGIPLAAGIVTRVALQRSLNPKAFSRFLSYFGTLSLLGLLYTIIVLFASQGKRVVNNIDTVFRISVPLILYFFIVWTATFLGLYQTSKTKYGKHIGGYDKTVVQAFTAGSNNFELAIAIAVANFGTESPEALAATIGPLVEVPLLLSLSYVALWLKSKLRWKGEINLV